MATPKTDLTEAEWALMEAIWEHGPCAAPTIQEALFAQRKWTYSTVRTLLDRMAAKGVLHTSKVRHLTLFQAAITREQAQHKEVLYTLKTAFQGALTPMVQCLLDTRDLTSGEVEELEALLKAKRKERSGKS